jgi:hypothetical protein
MQLSDPPLLVVTDTERVANLVAAGCAGLL